jgi:3'-phosphoadenosine 5'-phosphosulfate sulfotransferase (PAPS reductase)/FAD synthetase
MMEHNLLEIEKKAIGIIKGADLKFKKIALLYNADSESTVMLALVKKALNNAIPFSVIYVDNGIGFSESYQLMEHLLSKWGIKFIVSRSMLSNSMSGSQCCGSNKEAALKKTLKEHGFDALMVPTTKGEHEAVTRGVPNVIRPISHFSEKDIWRYMQEENLPVNKLNFAVDGYRYIRIGCTHCSIPIRSSASSFDRIIDEIESGVSNIESKSNKKKEADQEYMKEKLRALGYM